MSITWAPFSTCWRATVVVTAFEHHAGEGFRAGDVGPFADVYIQRIGPDVESFQPREAQLLVDFWHFSRVDRSHPFGDGLDVLRRSAAAAANNVHDAALRPALDFVGQHLGRLVVAAEGVGQAGIRVGRDVAVADAGKFLDVLAQFLGAERAVQAKRQWLDMVQRIPESLGGLAGQRAAGGIGNRPGNHHRPAPAGVVKELLDGEQRGLGVQCVEHGFDEQDVGAAFNQSLDRFQVIVDQRFKGNVAEAGVIDVGRDRGGAAGWPRHAGNEARLGRIGRGEFVAQQAGEASAFEIQLMNQRFQLVVGLRHGGRVEGAGFENIGPGFKVGAVDAADDRRLGQHQQVVVALQVMRMLGQARAAIVGFLQAVALDHGAHRAVENEQALFEQGG